MLDINLIRQNPEIVKKGIASKNTNPKLVDDFLALDENWRKLTKEIDDLRAEQNKLSDERKIEEATKIKDKIQSLEKDLKNIEKNREEILWQIPNLPSEDTPVGRNESENKVLRQWSEPKKFDFKPRDHVELGELLDIIDIGHASKVSGTRFNYLKGPAALLEFSLINYVFDVLTDKKIIKSFAAKIDKNYPDKPFIPVLPPTMIRPDVLDKMGRLKPEEERYYIPKDDLYLAGSAEHTLGPLHMDEIIPGEKLPIRYVGFSTSFRREAGSYGKDTRGILRVHQFDKLEIESFTVPEDSTKEQDFIVAIQEYLMQSLEIPYQVVAICTGDMGGPDTRQIDIEAWLPSQNRYRETHTSDMMTDYQARRLNTRVKRKDGKLEFVHMNDATAFAIGRTLIAILENYQQKDGSILVPKVLQKYLNFKKIG
ncbi:MAG: serine--tRNA ligase [Candidatus Nealsonbacteria bacterium CG_4_9_14_0_8_um_filter_36_17]|uniref:Serine--tRNA ligase n=1 Tax=Candidatus Nealsonbacteria bacterium CG_4_9_14_0_8_um_filter_36_17 TaxID=1974693 RepID=A0A2M8DM16_9BACT|nr:MAG: serine--tRNA ligase [Candidatus Nealsonbacteria bacterium CG_4_9_14_0_8_um_filter_36_17]